MFKCFSSLLGILGLKHNQLRTGEFCMVSIVSLNRAGQLLLSKMVPGGPSHLKERQTAARKSWSKREECL